MSDSQQNEITKDEEKRKSIVSQCVTQLSTSRSFKRQRMAQIFESEKLYYGIVEPQARNPFNECFPYMAGFIDHYKAKITDDSNLIYVHQDLADYKKSQKIQAFYDQESKSIDANACWNLKHRQAKVNALFSGVAIYKYFSTKTPKYKSYLDVISHYDFHCEPRGGMILEKHLFCGQENIFKSFYDLESDDYDKDQVDLLKKNIQENGYKTSSSEDIIVNNKFGLVQQSPNSNNYVGQHVIKFVEWYTTYRGVRYYVLFEEGTGIAVRVIELSKMFSDNSYPFITWHTHEDSDLFWNKAPADDARTMAKIINTFLNQELYNRQKSNNGETHYDAEMYPNVQALIDSRPDKYVPVDTFKGTRTLSSGIFKVPVVGLNGTLDFITWLEQFTGKQLGHTASSAGQSEKDKKVGVFEGEIKQVEQLISVKNNSFKDALSLLGQKFKKGLEDNLTTNQAVQIMGAKGIEWAELTPEDLKTNKPLTIKAVGGLSELQLQEQEKSRKNSVLATLQSVNIQWKEKQALILAGWTEEEIRDAWSQDSFATKELLAEASEAERAIVQGENPPLNRGADSNFMQHIVDFAKNTNNLSIETYTKLMEYAMAHTEIATQNELSNVKEMIRQKKMKDFMLTPNQDNQIIGKDMVNNKTNQNVSTL